MGKEWTSNATWSNHADTQDTHHTEDAAQGVCGMMMTDYTSDSPCKYRGVCLRAWVEKPKK